MALSERELRILGELEESLHDCERRCAAIQRRKGHRRRRWLILLCCLAPVMGTSLILLGAMTAHGGIAVALLGSAVLAVPCACVRPLCSKRLPKPSAQLRAASPENG